MKTVYHCKPEEFCPSQKETGGEYGVPLEIHCMNSEHCKTPEKQCLFRKITKEHPGMPICPIDLGSTFPNSACKNRMDENRCHSPITPQNKRDGAP